MCYNFLTGSFRKQNKEETLEELWRPLVDKCCIGNIRTKTWILISNHPHMQAIDLLKCVVRVKWCILIVVYGKKKEKGKMLL